MTITRLSIFPLAGALLFPRMHLPLHIFEPRYRAMITDSLARDRRIGMIQPRGPGEPAPLFDIGCVGKIAEVEALDDGRFDIVLEGLAFAVIVYVPLTALYVNLRTAGVWMPRLDPPDILMAPALLVAIGIALAYRRYQ